jgi:hypothetical protein
MYPVMHTCTVYLLIGYSTKLAGKLVYKWLVGDPPFLRRAIIRQTEDSLGIVLT